MLLAQLTNSPAWWQFLSYSKDSFASLESCFKILAIVGAGIWAYSVFLRKREKFPRSKPTHQIEFWDISDTQRLLRVTLNIPNDSDVLLRIDNGFTWIQQMKPWPTELLEEINNPVENEVKKPEIPWPLIEEKKHVHEREIEPKESDEMVMDFVLQKTFEQVLVYSHIENCAKPGRHLGWNVSTVVNFAHSPSEFRNEKQTVMFSGLAPELAQAQQKPRPAGTSAKEKNRQ